MERRPEDHAVEENIKEALDLSHTGPRIPGMLPAEEGVEGELVSFNASSVLFHFISFHC